MKNYTLRLLLPVLFSLSFFGARAQWVPIDLGAYDQLHQLTSCTRVDSAMQNYYLDTICSATAYIPRLDLDLQNLDLRWLPHTDSLVLNYSPAFLPPYLRYLQCEAGVAPGPLTDSLRTLIITGPASSPGALPPYLEYLTITNSTYGATSLPPLPATLKHLDCSYLNLTSLPALPAGLEYLNSSGNVDLDSLPSALPPGLRYLNCALINTAHITIPALPATLTYLNCSQIDSVITLPQLPAGMDTLICSQNNLTSISVSPALSYLNCSYNQIPALPSLPSTLRGLDCSGNRIPSMPALPAGMTSLDCSFNRIPVLPTLPSTLLTLNCSANLLPSLPALPASLITLNCGSNPMTAAIAGLPAGLQYLYMPNTAQSAVPALPAGLLELNCSSNPITVLPAALPATLRSLACSNDAITQLPALPSGLKALECSNTHLIHLPYLPAGMTDVDCVQDSALTDLTNIPPRLNNLTLIDDVLLSCLPPFPPDNNMYLNISSTNIRCLPNLVGGVVMLPLCTPASGCSFSYNIQGNIHQDTSTTCAGDSIHPGAPLRNIKVMLEKNGAVLQQMYAGLGEYAFTVDSMTTYDVVIDSSVYPLAPACPSVGMHTVPLSATDTVAFGQNFGLSCTGDDYRPLGVNGTFRPGQQRVIHISAGSLTGVRYGATCGTAQSGEGTVLLSGPVSYVGPDINALTPSAVAGNMLTYSIADISALNDADLDIIAATDSSADMDSTVCITVIIKSATPDLNVHDDTLTICNTIRNSFDPNHKDVYPAIASPDGDWLTYTIHFQNTGNDTAYTVVLRDTLSSYVLPETFEYLASSHPAVIQLNGKAMTFTFAKINLVDSATNPPLSEGWIQYRVRSRAGLPLQTQIPNTAYIFFDLNAPIVTNTAVTTVDTVAQGPSGIRTIANATAISLYPNPNTGLFTLQSIGAQVGEYTVTDMLGKVIQQRAVTGTLQPVDMRETAPGIYTIAVKGAAPLRFTVVK